MGFMGTYPDLGAWMSGVCELVAVGRITPPNDCALKFHFNLEKKFLSLDGPKECLSGYLEIDFSYIGNPVYKHHLTCLLVIRLYKWMRIEW